MPIPKQRYWNMNVIQPQITPSLRRPYPPSGRRARRAVFRRPSVVSTRGLVFDLGVQLGADQHDVVESQIQVMKPITAPSEP